MPFRRRFTPRVKTDKHEITWSDLAIDASSTVTKNIVQGVQTADADTAPEVEVGNHVSSIYFEVNFAAQTITNPKVIHWIVSIAYPQTGAQSIPSLYYQTDRSLILKRGMEMLPADVGTVYKRIFVVKIPKKFQRIAETALIRFRYISTLAETVNVCGFAIYKEWK